MISFLVVLTACLSIVLAALPIRCFAQEEPSAPARTIEKITFQGNYLISAPALMQYLTSRKGQTLDRKRLAADVQRLEQLPFLSDVSSSVIPKGQSGAEVIIRLSEHISLSRIEIAGNRKLGERRIRQIISSRAGEEARSWAIERDVRAISDLYRQMSYPLATVSGVVSIEEQQRGILTFHIIEGPRCWVEQIRFEGNERLSADELRSEMKSKQRGFLAFLFPGYFKGSVFDEDLQRIENLYLGKGYLDAKVGGYASHSRDMERVTLHVLVYEGPLYTVSGISFRGNTIFRDDEILREIPLAAGKPFAPDDLEKSKRRMEQMYRRQGYFDVSAMKETLSEHLIYDEEKPEVAVEFAIREGEPVFIRRIRIEGLTMTRDDVVRRNLTFYPGERADSRKIEESKRKLRNTGCFDLSEPEPVRITLEPDEGALRDALVKVKEGRTGTLFFGGGVSSREGLIGEIALREENFDISNWPGSWSDLFRGNAFRGGGQKLLLRMRMGTERAESLISFRNPYASIWGWPCTFGTSLYAQTSLWDRYDERHTGASVSVGKRLAKDTLGEVTVGFEKIRVDNVDPDAAFEIRRDEGSYNKAFIKLSHIIDRRDEPFVPSDGYETRVTLEAAAGDVKTVKLTTRAARYWTVAEPQGWGKHIFSLAGRMSIVCGYGKRVPVFERLYAGGAGSLRGFDFRGVSPVDPVTEDQVGGKSMLTGSAEYSLPLVGESLRLVTFLDAGYVEEKASDVLSGWDALRVSTGLGLRWRLPALGRAALAIDVGFPIKKEKFDNRRRIHFLLGATSAF